MVYVPINGKNLAKLLKKKYDFEFGEQTGSHLHLETNGKDIIVPIHPKDIGEGLFNSLLKQIGACIGKDKMTVFKDLFGQ